MCVCVCVCVCFQIIPPWLFLCGYSIIIKLNEKTVPHIPGTIPIKMFLFNPLSEGWMKLKYAGYICLKGYTSLVLSLFRLIYRISAERIQCLCTVLMNQNSLSLEVYLNLESRKKTRSLITFQNENCMLYESGEW